MARHAKKTSQSVATPVALPPRSALEKEQRAPRLRHLVRLGALALATSLPAIAADSAAQQTAQQPATPADATLDALTRLDPTAPQAASHLSRLVLQMPFRELVRRLGALHFTAQSNFSMQRGEATYAQSDLFAAQQDPHGNFHVALKTPVTEVEVYRIGDDFFVRNDRGRLRRRALTTITVENWCETAFGSLWQAFEPFASQLSFTQPRPEIKAERPAMRFTVSLAKSASVPTGTLTPPDTAASSAAAVAPLAQWRALARPLELTGDVWVDIATGVALAASLQGRLEVPDRATQPTKITLSYTAQLSGIGAAAELTAPKHVDEPTRQRRDKDPLAFFRAQLPNGGAPAAEKK